MASPGFGVRGDTVIEAPKVPSGVKYGEGCPLPSRLGGLGERRELPQRGPGQVTIVTYKLSCAYGSVVSLDVSK